MGDAIEKAKHDLVEWFVRPDRPTTAVYRCAIDAILAPLAAELTKATEAVEGWELIHRAMRRGALVEMAQRQMKSGYFVRVEDVFYVANDNTLLGALRLAVEAKDNS